jgi:SAM-dependent methyltransferase
MKNTTLTIEEVLNGYDKVVELYPYIPSLSHWRAWECAAYRKFKLEGRGLDLGCGDGIFFRLIWPNAKDVVGVDMSLDAVNLAKKSGVYRAVHLTPAQKIDELDSSFDFVFANCSLEHMDHLDEVLLEIYRCLKPGGFLLCSVVTNRFVEWSSIPNLLDQINLKEKSKEIRSDFLDFHHLANPLRISEWKSAFEKFNFEVTEHIPILPKFNSEFFLLIDTLWHLKTSKGTEAGNSIYAYISKYEKFPIGFRKILEGLLEIESDWDDCSGAIFKVTKT